jgi:hypothetical protein
MQRPIQETVDFAPEKSRADEPIHQSLAHGALLVSDAHHKTQVEELRTDREAASLNAIERPVADCFALAEQKNARFRCARARAQNGSPTFAMTDKRGEDCIPQVDIRYTVMGRAGAGKLKDAEVLASSYDDPFVNKCFVDALAMASHPPPLDGNESTVTMYQTPPGTMPPELRDLRRR